MEPEVLEICFVVLLYLMQIMGGGGERTGGVADGTLRDERGNSGEEGVRSTLL